jgi:hypothetical protein
MNRLLFIALSISISLFGVQRKTSAQTTAQPFVVFVDGSGDCCAKLMQHVEQRVRFELGAEVWHTSYANFRNGSKTAKIGAFDRFLSTDSDIAFSREGVEYINHVLSYNRPLILIGHSFGGDSVLKLLAGIRRQIQLVAVIDPVAWGGRRVGYSVPPSVDVFFNRWQENAPFPFNFTSSGRADCRAVNGCIQDSQNIARRADHSPYMSGGNQKRVMHDELPMDAFLQKELGELVVNSIRTVSPRSYALSGYYRNQSRPEVYFVNQATQTMCHVQNPSQMNVFGGFSYVTVTRDNSFAFATRLNGECAWPDGMYKTQSNAAVYLLHGTNQACWIRSPDGVVRRGGWNQVRVVDDSSQIIAGRTYRDRCD